MQLPYGSYTVVELNPDEGRDPIKFEVFIGRDPANPDEVEAKITPTRTDGTTMSMSSILRTIL